MFLEIHSFLRASLSKKCLHLGTNNVRGQISVHIIVPNRGFFSIDPNLYKLGMFNHV